MTQTEKIGTAWDSFSGQEPGFRNCDIVSSSKCQIEESTLGKAEAVNHPNHYQGANECIKVMEAMFGKEAVKHFCMCNAFKYRFRADKKNGDEDIRKAEWYETYLINMGGIDNDSK